MRVDGVLAVAADLDAMRTAVDRLSAHAAGCPLTREHFGEAGAHPVFAAEFDARRDDVCRALGRGAALLADLADALRAGARTVASADRDGADRLRSAPW